jgi:hypothetical protein
MGPVTPSFFSASNIWSGAVPEQKVPDFDLAGRNPTEKRSGGW